jgi:predicted nucleic acid-binding protein
MVSSVFMAVAPLGVKHREPAPAGALCSPRKRAPANRSRSPALISGQAVATGERIARAAAMMRWQLTCMAITVAGRVELLNCISARSHQGQSAELARSLLQEIAASPQHEFWPDNASYHDIPVAGIIAHRQVTDAYLAHLARSYSARLATFDQALAKLHPDVADLIPTG